ncbi:hypothetical protein [Sanguibacter antarcticus]|uniref:Uncharacterized protein n=1 Tax=Sanguibacter antarcticus TaxID=372484 RepID=A0A2A9E0I3_9MICO|nr:hypothetical protein [Sanguibacter antarcticus]PFG32448.1 hypothetical protein ATL42_0287 [Sanguibacter antarcticus]
MTTAVLINHVAAYAAAVREHLADLGPEQVDDLTDGLEADLAEALDDPTRPITGETPLVTRSGTMEPVAAGAPTGSRAPDPGLTCVLDLTARFGSPEAYAEELRSAAGLPVVVPTRSSRRRPVQALRRRVARMVERITSHRRWPAVREFLVSLRSAWWVARGWALFTVATVVTGKDIAFAPQDLSALVLLLVLVVASVQYGRGLWAPPRRAAGVFTALSVLAIVVLPFAAASQWGRPEVTSSVEYSVQQVLPEDGVYLDGEPVKNLFVYGPDGEFLDGARIVDDEGRPVGLADTSSFYDPEEDLSWYWEPRVDAQGRDVWNAYPVPMWNNLDATWIDDRGWVLPDGVHGSAPVQPFSQLFPLAPSPGTTTADPSDPATDTTDPAVDPTDVTEDGAAPSAP